MGNGKIRKVYDPTNLAYLEDAELRVTDQFRGTGFALYGTVTWINRDGNSQAVKLLSVTNSLGEIKLVDMTGDIARVLGLKIGHGGVIVDGYGMSALTQIQHALNYKIGLSVTVRELSESI